MAAAEAALAPFVTGTRDHGNGMASPNEIIQRIWRDKKLVEPGYGTAVGYWATCRLSLSTNLIR